MWSARIAQREGPVPKRAVKTESRAGAGMANLRAYEAPPIPAKSSMAKWRTEVSVAVVHEPRPKRTGPRPEWRGGAAALPTAATLAGADLEWAEGSFVSRCSFSRARREVRRVDGEWLGAHERQNGRPRPGVHVDNIKGKVDERPSVGCEVGVGLRDHHLESPEATARVA